MDAHNMNILLAGFGGQGVLFAGKLIASSALIDGLEVTWMPSYGPEMRGGTCNCSVCLSEKPIGSPLVTEPDVLVALNKPSYLKFVDAIKPGGICLIDQSLIDVCPERSDIQFVAIPATKISEDNDLQTLANVILVGQLLKLTGFSTVEVLEQAIEHSVSAKHTDLIAPNKMALKIGYNAVNQADCK
ncbi:MAG: 2-oxoacid:acceptor oxidoreductase family protein [Coriobacteriales bacterium]|jgi:2-oxoglutarate ferredoxin oxidoreductase subunit gamma|nr:2-oxoacid:acceptor oxidoreductase family protein [Coriobacteriales bacterium]